MKAPARNSNGTLRGKCIDCRVRPITKNIIGPELCDPCLEYAEWENTHSDYGHDAEGPATDDLYEAGMRAQGCWICYPELDARNAPVKQGHTNTRAHSHNSHADHGHALTPNARRVCRASIAAGNGPWNGTY